MDDISNFEDIRLLVNEFYTSVRADELIGPVFNNKIGNHWPEHLEKLSRFWQTVLLDEDKTYFGSPFPPHAALDIGQQHFDRWLQLFGETIDRLFNGKKADEAKWRAGKMAEMFLAKLSYYRAQGFKPLI